MAARILSDFLDDIPTCPVCLVEYNTSTRIPMILACAHTVCVECLPRLFERGMLRDEVVCPKCRKHSPVTCPRCVCLGFTKNYELAGVIEKLLKLRAQMEECGLYRTPMRPIGQQLEADSDNRATTSPPLKPIGAERQTNSVPPTVENDQTPQPQPSHIAPVVPMNALLNWAGSNNDL